jgi:DNA-binding GntR family transcriptional regulator
MKQCPQHCGGLKESVCAAESLIAQRARYGFWVLRYADHELQQISAMRADAEALVASALCARLTDTDTNTDTDTDTDTDGDGDGSSRVQNRMHDQLRVLSGQSERIASSNHEDARQAQLDFAEADTAFHVSIATAAGYDVAARHIRQWRNVMRLYHAQRHLWLTSEDAQAICDEHQSLWEAIWYAHESRSDYAMQLIEDSSTGHIHNALVTQRNRTHTHQHCPRSGLRLLISRRYSSACSAKRCYHSSALLRNANTLAWPLVG